MKRILTVGIIISLIYTATSGSAQTIILEDYLNTSVEIEGASDLSDLIDEFSIRKFDLNKSSIGLLKANQLISSNTVAAIEQRRKRGEIFRSVNDIKYLELGEEQENILSIISGVNIKQVTVDKFVFRNRIIRKTSESEFPIDPYKIYTRGNLNFSDGLYFGVLTERDVGEKEFDDYLSFYIADKNKNGKYDKIIGDYSIEAGQGLLLWQNGFFGRGGEPILSMKRRARGIRPYKSSAETNSMRGAAGTWSFRKFTFMGFVSSNKLDATLSDSGDVITFRKSGLHRTNGERSGKDVVEERIIGINTEWSYSDVKLGWRFATVTYDANINPSDSPDKMNKFEGSKFKAFSIDYDYSKSGLNLFGEVAGNDRRKNAQIHGLRIGYERFNIGLIYRDYDDGFMAVRGNPFGADDNEKGFYAGLKMSFSRRTSLSGFKDLYKRKWVTSTTVTPGRNEDFRMELIQKLSKAHSFRIRIWGANRGLNKKVMNEYGIERKILSTRIRRNMRFQSKHTLSRMITIGWRIERTSVEDVIVDETGLLFSANAGIVTNNGLRLNLAATRYNTDSFSSRIYLYERDLPGVFRNIAVFNEGMRFMVLARKEISAYFSLSIKLEHLSRNSEIEEKIENKIGIQIDISN